MIKVLLCPRDGSPIRTLETVPLGPWKEPCDMCGEDHEFDPANVELRYAFVGTPLSAVETHPHVAAADDAVSVAAPLDSAAAEALSRTMPLLGYVSQKIADKPMQGKSFLMVLHFLKDLIPFLEACERAGLDPPRTTLLHKEYLYPHRETIVAYLEGKGYRVAPLDSLAEVLAEAERTAQARREPAVILEDGGYVVPAVHKHGLFRSAVTGAVEQTTRGIRNDQTVEDLEFPVLSVADADLKSTYEPPHVADAVVRNLRRLLSNIDLNGRRAAVVGYGTVGRMVADRLRDAQRMLVGAYDPDPSRRLEAAQAGVDPYDSIERAVSDRLVVIGCSGETSIGRSALLTLSHGTYLVSASSDRKEVDVDELEALSSEQRQLLFEGRKVGTTYVLRHSDAQVHLLADGYLINFWAEESMPNQVSDLIMTLIFLAAVEVCRYGRDLGSGIDASKVNELSTSFQIPELYLRLHYSGGGR